MKKILMVVAVCPLLAQALDVSSSSLRLCLDEKQNGAITRAVSAGGVELGSARGVTPLFVLTLARADDFTKTVQVTSAQAKDFRGETAGGETRLVYTELGEAVEQVVCTVRGGTDAKIRWGISVTPKPGWGVTDTSYPRILCAEKIGTTVADDALVGGNAKGGVYRGGHGSIRARMPGSLVVQFACLYDDSALFYYAAEDGKGYSKQLLVNRQSDGVLFQWVRNGFAEKPEKQDYDVVMAALDGTAKKPCVWQDAADLYKAWAVNQSWCRTPYQQRPDIPAWMKDAPAMVRFNREMLAKPDFIRAWMKNYWLKLYPSAPLIMAYWGWERHGYWVSDYFPVYPSDEQFAALVKDCKAMNGHAFPWPSGYYWILDYNKNEKTGAFEFNDHAAYERRRGDDYACITREGKPYRRTPRWLNGGTSTCLCGGTQFCQDWWNNEICLPLAKLGCEIIQADQTVGGAFPACWSRTHGHEYGEGLWKKECFHRQMVTMRETMRTCEKDAVVCFEEPCELYNDIVGIQDYRTCEAQSDEWASVFNYVYHEYLPCFQSNPRRYDRVWQSHACADGQIPFLSPRPTDVEARPLSANGGSEDAGGDAYNAFMARWIALYHGPARKWLAYGTAIRPPEIYCGDQPFSMTLYGGGKFKGRRPTVFHSAWRAADGTEALVFVNATDKDQRVAYRWKGKTKKLKLKPDEIRLVEVK